MGVSPSRKKGSKNYQGTIKELSKISYGGDRMSEERTIEQQELWELFEKVCPQLPSESAKAYRAFGDTAFSGLSTRRLLARYQEIADLIRESYNAKIEPPPTLSLKTLLGWSKKKGGNRGLRSGN